MTLCVLLSTHCGSHRLSTLTIISKVFQCGKLLLQRCGSIGEGRVLLAVQDVNGKWNRKDWTDWNTANGRESVSQWLKRLETNSVVQLQSKSRSNPSTPTRHSNDSQSQRHSILEEIKWTLTECKSHRTTRHRESRYVYQIAVIAEEHGLTLNDMDNINTNDSEIDLHSVHWQRARSDLIWRCRSDAICLNLIALCSPLKMTKNDRHQIALKQNKTKRVALSRRHGLEPMDIGSPPSKRRKLSVDDKVDDEESDGETPNDNDSMKRKLKVNRCRSILFWQSISDAVSGMFQWKMMRNLNSVDPGIDDMEQFIASISVRIACHWTVRRLAIGSLVAECRLMDGLKANYFVSPSNGSNKVICTETSSQRQREWVMAEWNTMSDGVAGRERESECPQSTLPELDVDAESECETLSVLGFCDRDKNEWLPLPVLSRHFVTPHLNGSAEHIVLFLRDLMLKYNKMALVVIDGDSTQSQSASASILSPSSKRYGVIHVDSASNGRTHCLLLDVLSPYINAPRLFQMESTKQPTPQYVVPDTMKTSMSNASSPSNSTVSTPKTTTMLSVYDAVSCYFPTESTVAKDFEKLIRILKQKKTGNQIMAQCFGVAESIRRRSQIFQIPHLLHHLHSVVENEVNQIKAGGVPTDSDHVVMMKQLQTLCDLVKRSLTDKRVVITMDGIAGTGGGGMNLNDGTSVGRGGHNKSPSNRKRKSKERSPGSPKRGRGKGRGRGKRRGHHHHHHHHHRKK